LKALSQDDLEHLNRFGFDEVLFESWQKSVNQGWLSKENNVIQGELLAPPEGAIEGLPTPGSEDFETQIKLGARSIAQGELGVVILNGGMATRFGSVVKGVVDVLGRGRSFLGLKFEDICRAQDEYGGQIQVFLMNSFATQDTTLQHLEEYDYFGLSRKQVTNFTQYISVRMEKNGEILLTEDGKISEHGPGHGDFAPAFRSTGCLRQFTSAGGKFLFVSNVDNLGARVDALILGHHIRSNAELVVEVAPKWPGDRGGSQLLVDGKVQLVEQIRYPPDFDPDQVDVFNTNSFTFSAVELDRDFDLGWYYAEKEVEGRSAVQVERLIGEMTRFLKSRFVRIKRTGTESRFFPIKTPEDLEVGRQEIEEMYGNRVPG
jgi:UTP--glucose-1-phosphate uridylyltransferase